MYEKSIQTLTEHYARMAMSPHTVDQARHSVRVLRDDPSGLFKDLPELIKKWIEDEKEKKSI